MNDSHDNGAAADDQITGCPHHYVINGDRSNCPCPIGAAARVELLTRYTPGARILRARDQDDLRAVLAENEMMRQELDGLNIEWGVRFGEQRVVSSFTYDHEANAHHHAARYDDGETVSRLVGEWQPAEGDEP